MQEAWASYETHDRFALVGVRLGNGKTTWMDINRFGEPPTRARHVQMMAGSDGNLYAFAGVPGRFLKYDVTKRELIDLGVPAEKASYWLGADVGPDGKFYIGTYPNTEVVRCDPATGKIENLGRLTEDDRLKYVSHPVVSDDNIVYCPVGMEHGELWALDLKTGVRKQILPESMLKTQGKPEVWRGKDGRVYGAWTGVKFRCTPDAIVPGEESPMTARNNPRYVGDLVVGDIDDSGMLQISRKGKKSFVATDFTGAPRTIFSVSCERDGRIYGGTVSPAHTFSFDPATRKLTDHGPIASGPIQIYDTLNHERGLFISSYMNASVDFFDPAAPLKEGANPRRVVQLDGHERPMQGVMGPDGMIYTGTVPAKGRLGGVLLRVNPADLSYKLFTNVVPNQSILRLTGLPEDGQILGVTSINGGSTAIPTEKEACLFLWDCREEKVAFTATPLTGIKSYGAVVRAANGLVYGVAANRYYAFDPASRKVVFTGTLPVKSLRFPELADAPYGPRGLIYGMGDDAIFAIDPSDHSASVVARDANLQGAYGFCIASDGFLYFGKGSHLMRCRLP